MRSRRGGLESQYAPTTPAPLAPPLLWQEGMVAPLSERTPARLAPPPLWQEGMVRRPGEFAHFVRRPKEFAGFRSGKLLITPTSSCPSRNDG